MNKQDNQTDVKIGLIGGTGFYEFLEEFEDVRLETPYGDTSAPVSIGTVNGRKVAFMPRHGQNHQYLPHEVPYKANLWALRKLGVRHVIGFNTVGSLQREIQRGDFVLCDQFIDRTSGRSDTIFTGANGAHISSAEPYCAKMRASTIKALEQLPHRFHSSATVVVIQGPRFSTRAESKWFTGMGWQIINMTQYPEAVLARELELCYLNLSYVTDYDVAAKEIVFQDSSEIVSHEMVVRNFNQDKPRIKEVVNTLISNVVVTDNCTCREALKDAWVTR